MAKAVKKEKKETKVDPVLEFRRKLQSAANKNAKDLGGHLMDLEPPKGVNGAISTNLLCVDLITGGGFPKNRMSTISGDSSAGKTTLTQNSMGPELEKGTMIHYLDYEGAADYSWMLKNGVDINKYLGDRKTPRSLYYIPDFESGEDGFRYISRNQDDTIKLLEKIEGGASILPTHTGIYYIDSVAAMVSEELLENDEMGQKPDLAMMLSSKIKLVRIKLRKSNTALIAINQLRENPRQRFGSPFYEPGGNAPTFYADLKLWLTCVSKPKDVFLKDTHNIVPTDAKWFRAMGVNLEENPDGTVDQYRYTHIKTVKNRVFSPMKETYMRIWISDQSGQGQGVDPVFDTIRFYEEIGLCVFEKKSVLLKGKEYDYHDLKAEILTHPDLRQEGFEMLQSGKAFELYFQRLQLGADAKGTILELPSPELDEELNQLEDSE